MTGKTDRFIVKPQLEEAPVPYHDISRAMRELGPSYVYMNNSLVPEADMQFGVREVKQIPPDYKPHLEPHRHEVSEVYAVMGNLTIELTLDDERHELSGPASAFIPAGMMHTWRPLRGSGYLLVINKSGEFKASSDPKK